MRVLNPEDAKENGMDFRKTTPSILKWEVEGALITGMAKANPEINYRNWYSKSVLSYALDKVLEADVLILNTWVDGDSLTNYFEDGEIDQLYLNFQIHGQRNVMRSVAWLTRPS